MLFDPPPPGLSEDELARHPSWRRTTRKYQRKRKLVRDLWLFSGAIMVVIPPAATLGLALGTTFLAFMVLDETP